MKKLYIFLISFAFIQHAFSQEEIRYIEHSKQIVTLNCEFDEKEGRDVKDFKHGWKKENFEKPDRKVLKEKLTPTQYRVTQEDYTERPFCNEYWDNKEDGIYVDIISGEPLFSSTHKYESGTGWPSFHSPIDKNNLIFKEDKKLFSTRTEVRSKIADSHLGHVFDDGPAPTGLRYCLNSASLRFVPKDKMAEEGYEEYLVIFNKEEK